MSRFSSDHEAGGTGSLEGRVAFGVAAFVIAAGLVALVDRVGAPEGVVAVLGPAIVLVGLALLGVLSNAVRITGFYAAGRALPSRYAALAAAGIAGGLALPFLPSRLAEPSFPILLAGGALGLVGACLGTGPFLRKSGAFSIPDLLSGRFPGLAVRLAGALSVALCGLLLAVAGFEGAARVLAETIGVSPAAAATVIAVCLLAVAAPGGVSGVSWTAVTAVSILLAGVLTTLTIHVAGGGALPFPVIGHRDLWSEALERLAAWSPDGAPSASLPGGAGWATLVTLAIGLAALAPLATPSVGCRNAASARSAGALALVWILVFGIAIAAAMSVSTLSVEALLVGRRPEALPSFVYEASGRGLLSICGESVAGPLAALAACGARPGFAGVLSAQDVWAAGGFLARATPMLRGYGPALSGLVSAGFIAISVALAAAGLQAFAMAVAHDLIFRSRDASAHTSRRLAATRMFMAVAVIALAMAAPSRFVEPTWLIAGAVAISAVAVAPALVLTLWPRATAQDAALAMLVGPVTAAALVLLDRAGLSPLGLSAAPVLGFVCALGAGLASSIGREEEETRAGRVFVEGVLYGEGDLLNLDKGA